MSIPGSANPLLLKSAASSQYLVERSLRFSSSDSAFLSRTPASAGNRKTWTVSFWVKRAALGSTQYMFEGGSPDGATTRFALRFNSTDTINILNNGTFRTTTQVFRDVSAWYHILLAVDTTQSTASSRIRFYVNGSEVTTFSSSTDPSLNADTGWNMSAVHSIGTTHIDGGNYLNAYLADFYSIDGQALTPSSFTEVSATTGQLIPKKYSGPTPTGNSFWLPFSDNSAATATTLGKDGFLLGNNWTPNNIQVASSSTTNWTSRTSISSGSIWGWSYLSWIFDVNTATGTHSQGAITYSFSPGIPASGSLRLNIGCNVYHDPNVMIAVSINGAGYGTFPGAVAWRTIGWAGGTINSITLQGTNSGNGQALETFLNAIEVNGVQLIDNAAAQNDSLVDTPTSYGTDTGTGGEVRGNYATFNPINLTPSSSHSLTNGNLEVIGGTGWTSDVSTFPTGATGKWYAEITLAGTFATAPFIGIAKNTSITSSYIGSSSDSYGYRADATKWNGGSSSYGATYTAGDTIGIAYDADAGTLVFYKNGVSQGTAYSGLSGSFFIGGSFWTSSTTVNAIANFGQRPFAYTAPSGFKALCDTNLPAPVVAKPDQFFQTVLWTGDNSNSRTISGLNFSPDLVWKKRRTANGDSHYFVDSVRGDNSGVMRTLFSNQTVSEQTTSSDQELQYGYISALTSSGFTVSAGSNASIPRAAVNDSSYAYVAWAFDAGSNTVSNTQGSITSQVRANASAGFSIVTYTGNGSTSQTVGHGLGVKPGLIIVKSRSNGTWNWGVYHQSLSGSTPLLSLNTTGAANNLYDAFNPANNSSAVFGIGNEVTTNQSSGTYVAYCFSPVAGYSSFGSYTGNGSADGPFVFTGMRPRWIMWKCTTAAYDWDVYDAVRDPYNAAAARLKPNSSDAEATLSPRTFDILSNGFKLREGYNSSNASSQTYIYAAFAESPFQYARAR